MQGIEIRPGTMDADIVAEIERDEYHVADYVRPGDWVVDVGAYIGVFARYVHQVCPQARVLSFEPMPGNFAALQRNAGEVATVVQAAIVSRTGPVTLYDFGDDASACHSVFDLGVADARPVQVSGLSLADALGQYGIERVRLLKLDCQGAEYEIIANTPRDVLERVDYITMEVHTVIAKTGAELGTIPQPGAKRWELYKQLRRTHLPLHGSVDQDEIQVWGHRRLVSAIRRCLVDGEHWYKALRGVLRRGQQRLGWRGSAQRSSETV